MLTRMRKSNYVLLPAQYNSNPKYDFWVHLEFKFDAESSEVSVSRWWVTDVHGTPINLSSLTYSQVQFLAACMAEEFIYHSSVYYHDIEMQHYNRVSNE